MASASSVSKLFHRDTSSVPRYVLNSNAVSTSANPALNFSPPSPAGIFSPFS